MAYDVNLIYRSGKTMGNTDGLSRLRLPTNEVGGDSPSEKFAIDPLFVDVLMMGTESEDDMGEVKQPDANTVAKVTHNLHTDLWTSAVKAQEEDATNLAGRDNQKLVIQSFKVGDRDCARDFQAHSTAKWTTGIVQEVISPRSYWVELPQLDLRWHRSTDHLRSRGNGGPTEDADSERRTVVKVLRPEAVSSDIPAKELEPESHEPCSEEKESEAPCLLRTQLASPGPTTASPREVIEQRPALQERPARNRHPPRYLEDYVV
ncbi:hypothetical protein D918_09978 [Trichuris suis]|nr:hypothetical protein D918_09978 [Trichuris suis]